MARLKIEGLTKKFGKKIILDNVTLNVLDQSFTSILGPPGAGKTTLLRIIAGVEAPDKGRIYLDDQDVTELPPKDRDVAMIYQTFALYPHMTIFDNIANPLKARNLSLNEIRERVKRITDFLGISHLLNRYPRELSGGEKQRVAMARALVREAKIYLMDEPLTNLDYKLREAARAELKRMSKELGCTIIYTTPDPIDALAMSDYVYVLLGGKIVQQGLPREVYDFPKNVDVARYFSFPAMNFIDCIIKSANDKLTIQTPFINIDFSKFRGEISDGEYIIGIKPHELKMFREPTEEKVSFNAKLRLAYVIGSETIAYVDANGVELVIHLPFIYRIQKPEEVKIYLNPSQIIIFDKSTKERVWPKVGRNG